MVVDDDGGRRASGGLDVNWPYFGLIRTPNADNCCALLSNVLPGQTPDCLVSGVPVYIYGSGGQVDSPPACRLRHVVMGRLRHAAMRPTLAAGKRL
jgi:hypothetical protein